MNRNQDINLLLDRGIAKLERDPTDVSTLLEMGELMLKLKRWDVATLQFRHALRAAPASYAVRHMLLGAAGVLVREGQSDNGRSLYLSLLAEYPKDDAIEKAWGYLQDPISHKALVERRIAKHAKYKVSAIISTYRSAAFMRACLENLLSQSIADAIEIVIVDAASPENERDIIQPYLTRYENITYLRTSARIGIYPAWNIAIEHSRGRYCISVSTNDQLRSNACELLANELDAQPNTALVYGDTYLTRNPHETFDHNCHYGAYRWEPYSFERHLQMGCCIGPHPMWRRNLHEVIGKFDERFIAIGDQEFWMRLGTRYPIRHLPVFTGLHWVTSESLSGSGDIPSLEVQYLQSKYRMTRVDHNYCVSNGVVSAHTSNQIRVKCEADGDNYSKHVLKKKKWPTISIVTPSLNQGVYLEYCITSILNQNYPATEYIVMDGGSNDGSKKIIAKYEHRLHYWQSRTDGGQYAAIQDGLSRGSGEIMTWINSDDFLQPGSLHRVAGIFMARKEVDWITGRPNSINEEDGKHFVLPQLPLWSRKQYLEKRFFSPFIQQEGTFWRRSVWERSGAHINTNLSFAGDLELWVRFFRHSVLHSVDCLLATFRNHSGQKTASMLKEYLYEAEQVLNNEIVRFRNERQDDLLPTPLPISKIEVDRYIELIDTNLAL